MKFIEYPYPDKPEEVYSKLADLPGFSLLQSSDRVRGRYDIATAFPAAEYPFFIEDNLGEYIASLEAAYAGKSASIVQDTPPFCSGLIGYGCYELAYVLHGLPMPSTSKIHYQKRPLALFKRYDWALVCDHLHKTLRLYKPDSSNFDATALEVFIAVLESNAVPKPKKINLGEWDTLCQRQAYQQGFTAVQEALQAGRSYQVNLTLRAKADFTGDAWSLYRALLPKNPVPFAAFLSGEESLVSFSPERYMQIRQEALLASPIKGTAPRSSKPDQDQHLAAALLASEKNRAENTMIVDMWRNDLARIAEVASVSVPRLLSLESYQTVHHLVTDIRATARRPASPLQNFLACYPAASITGAPKREAMRIIAENETNPRGMYCGSVAYFSDTGMSEGSVAIRSITVREAQAEIGTGAGIVVDSSFCAEFEECVQKISSFCLKN